MQIESWLQDSFNAQQRAFEASPMPDLSTRLALLISLQKMLLTHEEEIALAINRDFGNRSKYETRLIEITGVVHHIKYLRKNLKRWMKPLRRKLGLHLQPGSARVVYQPLGVVGIMVPFNYPLLLALVPVATALAAGNRVMVKMSESTPETANILAAVITESFSPDQLCVIGGDVNVSKQFASLPFDHLMFTGSTATGKHIMRAAADNLTPVTLELGGKSPVIIDTDFPLEEAVSRVCFAKSLNAGQTCVAPDYVLIPETLLDAFIEKYSECFNQRYPDFATNPDYTTLIHQRHWQHCQILLQDALEKGAKLHAVVKNSEAEQASLADSRKQPPMLLSNVDGSMLVMQQEIFGPLLPIVTVKEFAEALHYVRHRPRPLALYYFGFDEEKIQRLVDETHSGSVAINELMMQVAVDDLPFGGIGPSGMGNYHGKEGFITFSHVKSILLKGRLNTTKWLYPPFKRWIPRLIMRLLLKL